MKKVKNRSKFQGTSPCDINIDTMLHLHRCFLPEWLDSGLYGDVVKGVVEEGSADGDVEELAVEVEIEIAVVWMGLAVVSAVVKGSVVMEGSGVVVVVVGLGVGGIGEWEVNATERQAATPRTPRSTRTREIRSRIWIRLNLRLRL